MKATRLLLSATALAVLSACAVERKPPPAPVPAPRPAPTLAPAPPPPPADWRDAPATPGNWSYGGGPGGTVAAFGAGTAQPLFSLTCERAASRVVLRRSGSAPGPVPLTVTTTSGTRSFTVSPSAADPTGLSLALAPRDPVLDAMAFSRGRFMVEVPGLPTLYLPAWPEMGRVIEDCR